MNHLTSIFLPLMKMPLRTNSMENNIQDDRVWVVCRRYPLPSGEWAEKVEYIVRTEEEAEEKAQYMDKNLDSRFGVSIKEWIID